MDNLGGYLKFAGFCMNIEFENILDVDGELIEQVRKWRNSENVSKFMYTNHHISKEEHQKWVKKLQTNDTVKAWIIKYNGKPVGLSSLSDIDYKNKSTEWGFYIADESTRGKGVGSAALYKLMEYVFDEMNFEKMHTKVLDNNPTALKLYEKFGFKKERELDEKLERDGKQINVFIMSIFNNRWKKLKGEIKIQA